MVLFSSLTTAPRHWLAWLRINGILGSMDENNTAATDEAAAALLVIPSSTTEPLFTFGTRQCTWYMLIQEILMGFVLILPITIILGQIVLRMNCSKHIVSIIQKVGIRADLWNATTALIVADLILELLIPSAKCLPTMEMFPYPKQQEQQGLLLLLPQAWLSWFGEWFKTMWGLDCYIVMEHDILTPFALFGILSIRFTFVVLGLSLGQSFAPIAITGGIGTGKSTIVQMLLNPSQKKMMKNKENNNSKQGKKSEREEEEEESYSFYVIDCDKIGHEILLPSEVLALSNNYSVQPRESVYKAVCQTFQEYDIFVDNDNNNDKDQTVITTTTRASSTTTSSNQKNDNNNNKDFPKQIDRTKLGTIVFANANKRYQLNQITHARIFWILLKHCLYGCWILSGIDFTIVEVPLLYESKSWLLRFIFCMTLMVTVPNEQIQLERIQLRNPELSIQECQNRIHSQMSLTQKEQYADFVLMNYDHHCDNNNNNHDHDKNEHGDHHHSEATRTRTTTIQAELFQRIVERGWVDRLFGIGVSVAQIVGIVGLTLAAGVAYYLYHRPFVPNNI